MWYPSQSIENAMFTVSSLLVPTDFSQNADQALGMAKEIARGTNATLHIVHIVEPVDSSVVKTALPWPNNQCRLSMIPSMKMKLPNASRLHNHC